MYEQYAFPAAAANGAGPAVAAEVMENVARTAHRATLVPKEEFVRFRTHRHRFGTGLHVVWGVKPKRKAGPRGGRVYVHALLFDKKLYSPQKAKQWLKSHGYTARRFETAVEKLVREKKRKKRVANVLPVGVAYQYVASMNPVVAANKLAKETKRFMNAWLKAQGTIASSARRKPSKVGNPSLMILTNPRTAAGKAPTGKLAKEIRLAQKAYKSFHFGEPKKEETRKVPDGWPKVYVVLGVVDAFETKTGQGKVRKAYHGRKPILACTKDRKDVFIFSKHGKLGIPRGVAVRVEYTVPPHSGRNKWSKSWYHPHDTGPKVNPHPSGRAVKISGPGLSVSPRGIIG